MKMDLAGGSLVLFCWISSLWIGYHWIVHVSATVLLFCILIEWIWNKHVKKD